MAYNTNLHGPNGIIPQPVKIGNGIVENEFANSAGNPDVTSTDLMTEYLIKRLYPPLARLRIKRVLGRTGIGIPIPRRVPNGTKQVSRLGRTGNWIVSPRAAAFVVMGSLAASVVLPAVEDAADEVGLATHEIARLFNPLEQITVPIVYPEVTPTTITINAGDVSMINDAGQATVSEKKLASLAAKVAREFDPGDKVILEITAESSDELNTDEDIHRKEPKNQDFADERAEAAAAAAKKALKEEDVSVTDTKIILDQDVLTSVQKQKMLELANAAGYATITEAINAVQGGEKVNKELYRAVKRLFILQRGQGIKATIIKPDIPEVALKTINLTVTPKDQLPDDPDRDYDPWLIPLPPIPELERRKRIKDKFSWIFEKFYPFAKPITITDQDDKAWVRLRPEALKKDGTLVDAPWAYTDKFAHLLREDGRIKNVLRADFKDENGDDATLRIMFVDHSPAALTIDVFREAIEQFAAMQGGRLAKKITGIFVYPEKNAGYAHGNPKKIGIGVDEQDHEDFLGMCTPLLGLVEMHMPTEMSDAEIKKTFTAYMGSLWVLAHEVAGHGTDIVDGKVGLLPVKARGVKNAHIPKGSSWGDGLGAKVQNTLHRLLPNRDPNIDPVFFDITVAVVDKKGAKVTKELRVREDDPMLSSARKATIVRHDASFYASTNYLENSAETGAGVTTGISVPFGQAGVKIQDLMTDDGNTADFATGFHPSLLAQGAFLRRIGAKHGSLPARFNNPPSVFFSITTAEDDPLLREHMIRARSESILPEDEKIAILAQLTSSKR